MTADVDMRTHSTGLQWIEVIKLNETTKYSVYSSLQIRFSYAHRIVGNFRRYQNTLSSALYKDLWQL